MLNQDVDFLMSLFTEDAMLMTPGEPAARGSEQVRSWFENAFGAAVTEKMEASNEEYFAGSGGLIKPASVSGRPNQRREVQSARSGMYEHAN